MTTSKNKTAKILLLVRKAIPKLLDELGQDKDEIANTIIELGYKGKPHSPIHDPLVRLVKDFLIKKFKFKDTICVEYGGGELSISKDKRSDPFMRFVAANCLDEFIRAFDRGNFPSLIEE